MCTLRKLTGAAVFTLLATLVVTGPAGANSAAQTGRVHVVPQIAHTHGVKNGAVKAGSTWTLEYFSWFSDDDFCESFSFGGSHLFTGSDSDNGTWKGNITMTFPDSSYYFLGNGMVYKGKFNSGSGDYVGTIEAGGSSWGPTLLVPGGACF